MIDRRCPNCGQELDDYFADVEEWVTLKDFSCGYPEDGSVCGKCFRIVECDTEVECEHCGELLNMYAKVMQPCGDNEQVIELCFEPSEVGETDE